MEWIAKIAEYLKLPARYSWAAAIVSGLLLFLPSTALSRLRLNDFIESHHATIGIIFMATSVLAVLNTSILGWNHLSRIRIKRHRRNIRLSALNNLDPQEQAVLREFLVQRQNTIRMPIDHPVVAGLLAKGVLVQVGQMGERSLAGMLFSVAKHDDVASHLTFSMLNLPDGEPSEEDIEFVRDNRPEYMPEIEHHIETFHTTWRTR